MGSKTDVRRRWLGAVFLLTALGMLIVGETALRDRFNKPGFVAFWLVCLVFTCVALFIAFLDVWAIRRGIRQEQREFLEKTLKEIALEREARSRSPSEQKRRSH